MSNTYETEQMRQWIGHTAVDSNGDKVGKIHDVYEDDMGSGPEWLAISTGWFGTKMSFAPVAGSRADGDTLILPWTKDQIKNSPAFDTNDDIVEEGHHLYSHYGMDYGDNDDSGTTRYRDRDTRNTGNDDAMTRSEEEVGIQKRETETGRVRLKKWVETENVHVTVPVRREVARLVTEPITDANRDRALDGPEIRENEHDVVLHEEEVVVEKNVVPKERVRLETDTVEDQRTVDEQVRKERIAMESDDGVDQTSEFRRGADR
jgi:uncharacterized protein (TIGR02271 family)